MNIGIQDDTFLGELVKSRQHLQMFSAEIESSWLLYGAFKPIVTVQWKWEKLIVARITHTYQQNPFTSRNEQKKK